MPYHIVHKYPCRKGKTYRIHYPPPTLTYLMYVDSEEKKGLSFDQKLMTESEKHTSVISHFGFQDKFIIWLYKNRLQYNTVQELVF